MIRTWMTLAAGVFLTAIGGCDESQLPPDDVLTALSRHNDQIGTALQSLCPIETDSDGQIVAIDLTNLQVSDRGLDRIAELPRLRRLYLSTPAIGEPGFTSLQRSDTLSLIHI